MPYDLTHFITYLENTSPSEIVKMMDNAMHDKVLSAEYQETTEGLGAEYLDLMLHRNQFALMAGLPLIKEKR